MPRNNHRLDLLCVPLAVDHVVVRSAVDDAIARWNRDGACVQGAPTARFVVGGGAANLAWDVPSSRVVYGNQLGGTAVSCPGCRAPMASVFAHTLEVRRNAGALDLQCPACGWSGDVHGLVARPPFRVGRCALVFIDASGPDLTAWANAEIEALVGPFVVVLRRVA